MRRRSVCVSVFLVLALLLPTLLGCGKKAPYGPAQVHFPEDEGAHPESKMEWWYLNATVSDNEDHQYTAMLAYFRPSLKILSIADLEADAFYQEVSTIPELMVARPTTPKAALTCAGTTTTAGIAPMRACIATVSGPKASPSASVSIWFKRKSP